MIIFPSSPIVGQEFAADNGITYIWDGVKWEGNVPGLANVASDIIPASNVTFSLGNATNQWSSAYIGANTLYINNVPITTASNTLVVNGANVVTVGAGNSITVSGNITGSYIFGNGSQLTGLPAAYSNTNATSLLANFGSNTIVTTGNITGGYILGNGRQLTGLQVLTGNLSIIDQTISGNVINGNIVLAPEGSGTVVVPGLAIPTGVLTADNGDFNIDSVSDADIRMSAGTGTIVTGSNIIPSTHDTYLLGNDDFHFTKAYIGTGGIDILNNIGNVNVTLKAMSGNLVVGNASGLTVADFTFFNNAITIANLSQDIRIGTVGATGNVIFNRSIKVRDNANTRNVFSAGSNGFVEILANVIPTQSAGALNIVGSEDGSYQLVNGAGGMLHITGNPDTSARITVDGWTTSATSPQPPTAIGAGLVTFRAGRGTPGSPLPMKAGDHLGTIAALGYTGSGQYSQGQTGLLFYAAEDFTSNVAIGTYANLQITPVGSNVAVTSVQFLGNGINLPTSGSSIKFPDATVQTTAFDPTEVVTSLSVGTGLTAVGGLTQGAVSINATGVQNVVGTSNQIIVTDAGSKNLTLSLPQNINTNSSVQFANITVGNIIVTGNTSSANTLALNDKTFILANNSTSASQIDGGGMILGNVADGSYYRTFLYDLNNDRWDTDGAGLATLELTAANVYIETLWANSTGHFGGAYTGNTYSGAVLQADSDVNSYSQIISQNHSSGTDASTDFVATNNIGTDLNNFIDMGVNSSTYSNPDYSITGPNDGYVFVNGGNIAIGTQSAGTNVVFHTGNTTSSALRATISDTGLSVVGNITAGNVISTNSLVAANLILSGNINAPYTSAVLTTAAQPNVTSLGTLVSLSVTGNTNSGNLRTAGQVSATGAITGGSFNSTGNVSTTGNVIGGNLIAASGEFATTISASGNITGANLIATSGTFSAAISATANITGANVNTGGVVSATGNIRGANFNTSGLVSATGNIDSGNLRTGGQVVATGNITSSSTVVGANIVTTGNVSATGNIAGSFILGNGAFLTGLAATYGDSNVVTLLGAFGSNTVSTTGNVTASYFIGNGSTLSSITGSNVVGAVANATFATSAGTATSATTAGTVTTNAQPNITSVGTLTSLSVTANVTGGNLLTGGIVSAASHIGSIVSVTANVTGGNLLTGGIVSATGNITTSGNFVGNGAALTGIVAGFQNQQVYTTGTGTGVTIGSIVGSATVNKVKVTVVGGGGAGGGTNNKAGEAGGGGGAGATAVYYFSGITNATTFDYAVGAGGAVGATNQTGNTGGASTFTLGSVTLTANGGTGGVNGANQSVSAAGGDGGVASQTGGVAANFLGNDGGDGCNSIATAAIATATGGQGGSSTRGGAGKGKGVTQGPGNNGKTNTGGGGGGGISSGTAQTGGAGGSGVVVIEW